MFLETLLIRREENYLAKIRRKQLQNTALVFTVQQVYHIDLSALSSCT